MAINGTPSLIHHAILSSVYERPMHGYRIRQRAAEYAWIHPINESSIYPALHDLEREGLLTHHSETHNGRGRKVYSITERGRDTLGRWMARSPESEAGFSDDVALRVALSQPDAIRGARGWMASSIELLQRKVAEHETQLDDAALPTYARLAIEHGVEMLRLRIRLLERVLDTVDV